MHYLLAQNLTQTLSATLLGLAIALLIAVAIILYQIRRALRQFCRAAVRLSRGDLSQPVRASKTLRLTGLSDTLDEMAVHLEGRLSDVIQQRNELGAVLSSMREGVLAIDLDERVLSLNHAAAELLGISPHTTIGRPIQEVIRNATLQDFVTQTLKRATNEQAEMSLRLSGSSAGQRRDFQILSGTLRDARSEHLGAVIVLHDVTQLRRLERIRQEFVANVSHEVKTPVSAIKAATETLLDDPDIEPAGRDRFLRIVARQAIRLEAIVEDLLSLARIEQEQGEVTTNLEPQPIAPVLTAARETVQAKADARSTQFNINTPQDLTAQLNSALLEQAVINLLDNAVKYSPEHSTITITARAERNEVIIEVTDQGRGIEPEHLPRIFERFYRTDRSRSRDRGGTGLGLSIVKHVAEAHGGRVSVDSKPGQGTTFRVHLQASGKPLIPAESLA
ncbi:MAG: ATP-binding protein [Phycisphaeraceae bacterium]